MLTNTDIKSKIRNIVLYLVTPLLLTQLPLYAQTKHNYSLRKYAHVKKFYATLTPIAIEISKKDNIPPAALLAIAGLESGYGRGYVAQITGNVLSLGAFKSDPELPALYLPYSKSKKKILFDPHEIEKLPKSDLSYKLRAKSLKKDYRPIKYAGSYKNLALLKYNKQLRLKAYRNCLNDFATKWISLNSNMKSFRDARKWLNSLVAKGSYAVLLKYKTNEAFIHHIGGKRNSFNHRESWPKKAIFIMNRAGLVPLVNNMINKNMNFNQAWSAK